VSIALLLSYIGFVSLGLPDTVLGAAWPAIRADFGLPLDAAGEAVLLTTGGIVLSSTVSSRVRARFGTVAVLVGSTVLASLALALAAAAPRWAMFLAAALIAGLGGGAIDATLNDFVARRHSARQMNWLHACWGVGATVTPILVAALLASGRSWRAPYEILAVVEVALSLAFVATHRLWRDEAPLRETMSPAAVGGPRSAMWASVAMFLFYGGVEAGTGLWATSLLTLTRGASAAEAGALVGLYWGALTVGRFVLGAVADALGPARLLRMTIRTAVGAAAALALPGTPISFVGAALAVLGFALAPVYPLTMHDTATRFGAAGVRLVGYQVAAASVGIATLPWLVGKIGARSSVLLIPLLLLLMAVIAAILEVARRRGVPRQPPDS
jgi:fucose permease